MSRRFRLALGGSAVLSATLVACQAILGISDFAGVEPPALGDATTSADGAADGDTGTVPVDLTCPVVPLTDAGPVPTEQQDGSWPLFAMRHVSFQNVVGLDLDCRNTQNKMDVPCVGSLDDGDGGRDLSYNDWVTSLIPGSDPVGSNVTARMQGGIETMMIRVASVPPVLPRSASGLQVGIARSTGLSLRGCDPLSLVDGGGAVKPGWDGCDWWRSDTFTQNTSVKAYIQDGTMVAHFPSLPLTFEGVSITVYESVLIVKVGAEATGDGGTVPILTSGTIAGRIRATEAIAAAGRYELTSGAGPVCKTAFFDAIASRLCGFRDLPSAGRGSATAACDSLSFALSFDAVSARTSGTNPLGDAGDPCADVPIDASCGAN